MNQTVTIEIDMPEVEEFPSRTIVKCGETTVRVDAGSMGVYRIVSIVHDRTLTEAGDFRNYPSAVFQAREIVAAEERKRLLTEAISGSPGGTGE